MERIAIIGLGLIGGSIGLALKAAGIRDIEIAGVARSRQTAQKARKAGAIDVEARDAADAARGARLVIVAAPLVTTRDVFAEIAPALAEGATVTDAGSSKALVARWAKESLPAHASFVGGHPMAGKERQGIDAADAELFRGKPWVISPAVDASDGAIHLVVGLAQAAGAEPMFMDAEEHDSYVAAISHLPLVLSSALFSMAFGSAAWPELAALASSGFRDTTRLASGSPEMAHDIMTTNRENVLHWIDRFEQELRRYRAAIAGEDAKHLLGTFMRAQIERDNYLADGPPMRHQAQALPKVSLSDFLLGSRVAEFMRKQEEIVRAAEDRAEGKRP